MFQLQQNRRQPGDGVDAALAPAPLVAAGVNGRNFMHYANVDKHVTIVGPSTLSAMLQVVSQGLKSIEIQKDTEVIRKNVETLQKHLVAYDKHYKKIGNSLGATVGHYNNASKELGRIDKDIVKIGGGDTVLETNLLDKPHTDDD